MDYKAFIQRSDEILNSMSMEELRECLHDISRKTPECNRDSFLQLLEDYSGRNLYGCEGNRRKQRYKRLIPDEKAKEKLNEIKRIYSQIENGELCLSANGYEDYSNGYWSSEWIWEYEDNEGIGGIIEDAALFAHDCVNDCRYEEAVMIYELIMDIQVSVEDENSGDTFELSLEEMADEKLVGVNLKAFAIDVLYSNYQLQTAAQRAVVLYSYFGYPYFKDIHIEDIFSAGREELKDTYMFLQSWIDFLLQQHGELSSRLLKEGALFYKGTEGLLEIARKGYRDHPSVYMAALSEYEMNHEYMKMKEIGEEALDRIEDNLRIRGDIAVKTAQASHYVNAGDFMGKYWYEAFYSNSTVPNYLRLFTDEEVTREYKDFAEKRIEQLRLSDNNRNHIVDTTEVIKNDITEMEHKYLSFFSGHFDKVKSWCLEQKSPLGWSGNFIGHGVDLMLLYLYTDNDLRKAVGNIAARVSKWIGFNESKNLVFMEKCIIFETDARVQNCKDIFWCVFCLWKLNYAISMDDMKSHVVWLESIIDKRIDGIVGRKYRNKYDDVALLAAALGEVKESLGIKTAKSVILNKYHDKYLKHSAFRGALKGYID